ncbi:four-carbon acid sugar kinase family protein [Aquiflexum sp.]|uniref:four-carbon acid sugar kinase family protein n=1 Tax=Aquiflexum sp. TaxID=1872584 RepID=UPI0035931DD3
MTSNDSLNRDFQNKLSQLFLELGKTMVIVDDDPTGTQTVFDVHVLGIWTEEAFIEEFKMKTPVFFVLANTRSITQDKAVNRAAEIGQNLRKASAMTSREFLLVSRSDSTLRGHFPAELDAIRLAAGMDDYPIVITPTFFEGGRITENNIHYILEDGKKIPVSETGFARDKSFGYKNSDLCKWVEEKSNGTIRSERVKSLSIEEIAAGESVILEKLSTLIKGEYLIINSTGYRELETVCMALHRAIRGGKGFLFRTAASFVSAFAGIGPKSWVPGRTSNKSGAGGLIVVGSYVPKTTAQLNELLQNKEIIPFAIPVDRLVSEENYLSIHLESLVHDLDNHLSAGQHLVVYTSRELISGSSPTENLDIGKQVTEFLVDLVARINVSPDFILAKGGITSNDLAVKGLGMKRAKVLGQIIPGVPVWELGTETRFPQTPFIVFPGNVGDDKSLSKVFDLFTGKPGDL